MRSLKSFGFLFLLSLTLASCVGTDLVDEEVVPEKIIITSSFSSAMVGDEISLAALYFDRFGYEENCDFTWETENENIIEITANQTALFKDSGTTYLVAHCSGITDTVFWSSGDTSSGGANEFTEIRSGSFQNSAGGYHARGTGTIVERDGVFFLRLEEDFSTSRGPSVYLFLATHTNGNYSYTQGEQVITTQSVQITPNKLSQFSGEQLFAIPQGVDPLDYDNVVVYCILGPVFGFAQLN